MPMKLAVNYSLPLRQLVEQRAVSVDLYKCPPWPKLLPEVIQAGAPYGIRPQVHFEYIIGRGNIPTADWTLIKRMLADSETRYVNTHLALRANEPLAAGLDLQTERGLQALEDRILREMDAFAARLGAENVIIENVPWRDFMGGQFVRRFCEPEGIARIVEATGCGLLLDISHATLAAEHLGVDTREYLSALPVQHLREMHVTGIQEAHGIRRDHLPMTAADWDTLDWVLGHISRGDWPEPWLLAFEYGGVGEALVWRSDPELLKQQVPRLYQAVHNLTTMPYLL